MLNHKPDCFPAALYPGGGVHLLLKQRLHRLRGPAVQPDDGVVQRPARGAVPHHCRLALVGDAWRAEAGEEVRDASGRLGRGQSFGLRAC